MNTCCLTWLALLTLVATPAAHKRIVIFEGQTMVLPVVCGPVAQEAFSKFRLVVSRDQGKTWKPLITADTRQTEVEFKLPEPGSYWLAAQSIGKDGTSRPASLKSLWVGGIVFVIPLRTLTDQVRDFQEIWKVLLRIGR